MSRTLAADGRPVLPLHLTSPAAHSSNTVRTLVKASGAVSRTQRPSPSSVSTMSGFSATPTGGIVVTAVTVPPGHYEAGIAGCVRELPVTSSCARQTPRPVTTQYDVNSWPPFLGAYPGRIPLRFGNRALSSVEIQRRDIT